MRETGPGPEPETGPGTGPEPETEPGPGPETGPGTGPVPGTGTEPGPGTESEPLSRFALRGPYLPPTPLERVQRGFALALLFAFFYAPIVLAFDLKAAAFLLPMAALFGALAVPTGFFEAWLVGRRARVRVGASLAFGVALLLGGALVIAQTMFTVLVVTGRPYAEAQRQAFEFLTSGLWKEPDVLLFLGGPVAVVLAGGALLRSAQVRWRWHVPVLGAPALVMMNVWMPRVNGDDRWLLYGFALAIALANPAAGWAVGRMARRRRRRLELA